MRRLNHPAAGLMSLALIAAASARASAPACKAACTREPACVWVDPYKRLDEVKVKGFCHATERGDESDDD